MGSPSDFDFWLGDWDVAWEGGRGRNTITREYGGHVIFERFDGRPGVELDGMSVSVYRPDLDRWFQTWADNEGSYFALEGGMDGADMVLVCERPHPGGAIELLRMRFHDIGPDGLEWNWEHSPDGGSTWEPRWQISYERRSPATPPR